jgi:hypothetical protein
MGFYSIAECIFNAALMAQMGSSSWAFGTPKTGITASPINFSMEVS